MRILEEMTGVEKVAKRGVRFGKFSECIKDEKNNLKSKLSRLHYSILHTTNWQIH